MKCNRQTNIELCRIVAMLLVVAVHSGIVAFGDIKTYDISYWGILVMQSFSIVGVNIFVLISGYFSVSFKLRSVAKLVWVCFFYAVLSFFACLLLRKQINPMSFFWVSSSIWYIGTYIGLLCFSPILNSSVDKMDKTQFGLLIVVLLMFQTWYEYVPRLIPDFHKGYSIISFMILYLIARYVRLYDFPAFIKKYHIWIYVASSLLISAGLVGAVAFHYHPRGAAQLMLKYNSPLVILSSLGLFAFFAQKEVRCNDVVNRIASSCVGVLLLHTSPVVNDYVVGLFRELFATNAGLVLVLKWGGVLLAEFIVAVVVDQVRLFIERMWLNKCFSFIKLEIR